MGAQGISSSRTLQGINSPVGGPDQAQQSGTTQGGNNIQAGGGKSIGKSIAKFFTSIPTKLFRLIVPSAEQKSAKFDQALKNQQAAANNVVKVASDQNADPKEMMSALKSLYDASKKVDRNNAGASMGMMLSGALLDVKPNHDAIIAANNLKDLLSDASAHRGPLQSPEELQETLGQLFPGERSDPVSTFVHHNLPKVTSNLERNLDSFLAPYNLPTGIPSQN